MRKRYQRGSVTKNKRYWVGKWREDGRHRTKLLGKLRGMTKSQAREAMDEHMATLRLSEPREENTTVRGFVECVYFPKYRRKWKRSTRMTNVDRIEREILRTLGERELESLTDDELQGFLDDRSHLSFSTVDHLRWDLKQIYDLAVTKGFVDNNPATMLFTPAECKRPQQTAMTVEEVRTALGVLGLRERLIVKLVVLAGMRPGEVFALRRGRIMEGVMKVEERIYKGDLDTPKSQRSKRPVALSSLILGDMSLWLASTPDTGPDGWVFPSERIRTPMSKDNLVRRNMKPALQKVGLAWVDFHVLRRTHSSLMRELGIDPKVVADMMGHDLGVNLNVYTQTSIERRLQAAEALAEAFAA